MFPIFLNPVILGGANQIVEIDKAADFRRKYNRGRSANIQWVFGGCASDRKECFIISVPGCKKTHCPLIEYYIVKPTTIWRDSAKYMKDLHN